MRSYLDVAGRAAYLAWHDVMRMVCPPWDMLGDRAKEAWKSAAQEAAISFARSKNPHIPSVSIVTKIDG